jgi:hypothetical protein
MTSQVWPSSDDFADGASAYGTGVRRYLRVRPMYTWSSLGVPAQGGFGAIMADRGGDLRRYWFGGLTEPAVGSPEYAAGFAGYGPNKSTHGVVAAIVERQTYIADGEVTMVPRVKVISGADGHLIQHFVGVCGRVQNGLLVNSSSDPGDEHIYRPDGYYFLQLRDRLSTAEPVISLYRVKAAVWTILATAPLSDHETYTWGTPDGGAPRRMRMVIENEGGGARIRCYRSAPRPPGSFVAQAEGLVFNVFDTPADAITTAGRWGCAGAQATDNTGAAGEYRGIVLVESLRIRNAAGTALHLRDLWHRTHGSSRRHINNETASGLNYESRSLSSAYTGDELGQPRTTSPTVVESHYGLLVADPGSGRLVIGANPTLGGWSQKYGWYFDQNPAQSVQQHRSATVTFISTVTAARETRHFGLHLRASGFSDSIVRGKFGVETGQGGNDWKGGYRAVIKYEYVGGTTDTFTLTVHAHLAQGAGSTVATVLATADVTALVALGTEFKLGLEVQDFDQGSGLAVGIMCRIDNTEVVLTLGAVSGVTSEGGWLVDRRTDATTEGLAVGMYCNFGPPAAGYLASGVIYVNEFATEALSADVGASLPPVANNDGALVGTGGSEIFVDPGGTVDITVLANDEAFFGATIDDSSVVFTFQPRINGSNVPHGSATVSGTGVVTYNCPAGSTETGVYWRYRFLDSNAEPSNTGLIQVTIVAGTPPLAVDDMATVVSGSAVVIQVLTNDQLNGAASWLSPDPVAIITQAPNGTAVADSFGVVTFTSDPGAPAQDELFTYQATDSNGLVSNIGRVTVEVTGGGAPIPPTAVSDNASTISEDVIDIDILANDIPGDFAIDPATVTFVGIPQFGSATIYTSGPKVGEVAYTAPFTASNIQDTFIYRVKDVDSPPNQSNSALCVIAVTGTGSFTKPVANPDSATVAVGGSVVFSLTDNDTPPPGGDWDIDPASVVITTAPGNGSVTVDSAGTATFTSGGGDPAPSTETFEYTVDATNGLTSDPGLVTITVETAHTNPTANQDNAVVVAGGTVEIDVVSNDQAYGANIDPTTVTIVSSPTTGTAGTPNATTGVIAYTAAASDTTTSDSFTYEVSDDAGTPLTSAPGTVFITVTGTNKPPQNPLAGNDFVQVVSGQSTLISILANDKAYDGATIDPATVALTTGGLVNAAATYSAVTALVTFTSVTNAPAGIESFTYTVEDSNGWISNTATVTAYITSGGEPDPGGQETVPVDAETATKTGTLTTPASWPINEERIVGINSAEFDTGHRATMPALPKERRIFSLQMLGATEAERATLSAFFLAHRGTEIPFDWVHPLTKETIAVRFSSANIAAKHRSSVGSGAEDYRFDLIEVFDAGTYGA